MGYLIQDASTVINGQYNPVFFNVLNMTNVGAVAAEFNYQIFSNSVNIAGAINCEFDPGTSIGRFRINLPNNLVGTIQARARGTWSSLQFINQITRLTIEENTIDLNHPIEFLCNTSVAGSSDDIAFNLIYTFS